MFRIEGALEKGSPGLEWGDLGGEEAGLESAVQARASF